ncbi:MAG TPA: dodecin family protein [Candidatus Sumerlaeota bacterium]|nr:MAG: hypothetical protein BWZ08_00811 [candidate division BRC1 bacterium ADurb.BinA292]HOE95486.1 dodecin family protein [Candidatus Sumerlaeota bacterium]HOR26392.1 dodecin family protein [Candidatus Sumerlaeota bacterium]HPK03882.1 dodecin family protein [Candidatus Sumerlaeota bacterium]
MPDKVYKKIEVVGSSADSVSDAVKVGLARAGETVRNIDWFEVTEIRGAVQAGKPIYQVTMKIGFRLEA